MDYVYYLLNFRIMFLTPTINKYLIRKYTGYFFAVVVAFASLLMILNIFDTMQNFKSRNIDAITFWQLVVFKLPYIFNYTAGLIGFVSTVLFLTKLSATNEMVILLSSGIQPWRVYIIPVAVSLVLGVVMSFFVSPFATFCLIEHKKIERYIEGASDSQVIVSKSGIFFYETVGDSHRILETRSINIPENSMSDMSMILVDEDGNFLKRYDARKAFFDKRNILLRQVTVIDKQDITKEDEVLIPTSISIDDIENRFVSPELIPLWSMKKTIKKLANSGINTLNHELYYYKQILKPFIMSAFALLACIFLSVNNRDNIGNKLIVITIVIGIVAFFMIEILSRILIYNNVEPFFACLLPPLIIVLISNFAILHFQEA